MTKLDELIQELCPDGVEFVSMNELLKRKQISTITPTIKVKRNDYLDIGETPIISQEIEYISGYCNFHDKNIPCGNYVCFGDHSEHIKYINFSFVQGADGLKIMRTNESTISSRYLFHALSSKYQRHNNYERHFKYLTDTIIPVPPLPVQREIVRILDNFTELTAELTARKKQYAYYRDKLLTHSSETKICKLADVCESIADGDHMPPPKADDGIPFITISNITEQNKIDFSNTMFVPSSYYDALADKRKPHSGDILYTVVGSYGIPVCIEQDTKFVFQRHIAILRPRSEVIKARYMFHAMQSGAFKAQADKAAKGAAQKTIGLSSLAEMTLPVPDMCIQERLIRVLDNFDAICTDLNIGLPAEIEARQKQYEYYRDKLLSFEEKT